MKKSVFEKILRGKIPRYLTVEKIVEALEDNIENELTEREKEYVDRLRYIMQLKLEDMLILDHEVYEKVREKYSVSFSRVMQDIAIVERMLGSLKSDSADLEKAWWRYLISEKLKSAMKMAEEKGNEYNMAYINDVLGKHNLTNTPDTQKIPYEEIIPLVPEITSDVSVLGISPVPDAEKKILQLAKKYGIEYYPLPGKRKAVDAGKKKNISQ